MVKHKPLINVFVVPSGELPVKIFGINLSGLGLNWLQAIVTGKELQFIPVSKEKNVICCEVLLLQEIKNVSMLTNLVLFYYVLNTICLYTYPII